MVESVQDDFAQRLKVAMAGKFTINELAGKLGLSYQAVKKQIGAGSKYFSVPNHFKAAQLLGVNPLWLATGEGPREPSPPWPDLEKALITEAEASKVPGIDVLMRSFIKAAKDRLSENSHASPIAAKVRND